jgi:hypothetical protein
MIARTSDYEWRHEYPWGRKLPAKRIAELDEKRIKIEHCRRILRTRFEERMIDFDRQSQAVENDLKLARDCESDHLRRRVKSLADLLFTLGLDVSEKISTALPSEALIAELTSLWEKKRREKPAPRPTAVAAPELTIIGDDDIIEESYLDEDVILAEELDAARP